MDVTPKKIYETALAFIGRDASPSDFAPDEYGCAETVSNILIKAGCDLPVLISTTELNRVLKNSSRWKSIPLAEADAGDVIMSPTGMGGRNGVSHGHTGIFFSPLLIASNDSYTGNFRQNYLTSTWKIRYADYGGYPIYVYRRLGLAAPPVPTEEQKIAVATEAIKVATEAAKKPSLIQSAIGLLKAALALLGLNKTNQTYLG